MSSFEEAWKIVDKKVKKAMTDEEMVYVKMPKSMLSWIEELMDPNIYGQEEGGAGMFPDEHKDAHTPLSDELARVIDRFSENPDIYHDSGYDGNMAGHYGGYTLTRPDMTDLYNPMDEDMNPLPNDYTGEYYGDEGMIRGELSKLKLIDALRNMGLMG